MAIAFGLATTTGNTEPLVNVLAEDAIFYSDGGGRVSAALLPIRGRDRVARFVSGVGRKFPIPSSARIVRCDINGLPGILIVDQGVPIQTLAFEFVDGKIAAVYAVRNPDKLAHVTLQSAVQD